LNRVQWGIATRILISWRDDEVGSKETQNDKIRHLGWLDKQDGHLDEKQSNAQLRSAIPIPIQCVVKQYEEEREEGEWCQPIVIVCTGDTRTIPFIEAFFAFTTERIEGGILAMSPALTLLAITRWTFKCRVLTLILAQVEPKVTDCCDFTAAY
jgi:hypothetical protein